MSRRTFLGAALGACAFPAAALRHAVAQPSNPAWPSAALAAPPPALQRLADRLARLDEDGLDPRLYDAPAPAAVATDPAGTNLALLRAAAAALTDLLHGRIQSLPGRVDLQRDTAALPLAPWLAELVASPDPAAVLDRAALLAPDAAPLKAALAAARARLPTGGYPTIAGNLQTTLEPGSTDYLRVPQLRARLAAADPAVPRDGDSTYDPNLQDAAKRFQAAVGLEPDGRIGPITWTALNRPAEATIRQLRVALDMRRAPVTPGPDRRIEVNIPFQRLQVMDGTRVATEMNVVVGRPARATPMLRVRMTTIMFNPPWGVPIRNAVEDKLPQLQRNPLALQRAGIRIFQRIDGEVQEVDPATVDWRGYTKTNFPFSLRQDPGEANALGRIKFIMPNNDDIYMHDTPERHLFRSADRAQSSGCIRLERPMEMLAIALAGTSGWDVPRAERALAARTTSSVAMGRGIPVRLHYTSVVVSRGEVIVRGDIYGLDQAYARAMDQARPLRVATMRDR